jgi:hypothetical protein
MLSDLGRYLKRRLAGRQVSREAYWEKWLCNPFREFAKNSFDTRVGIPGEPLKHLRAPEINFNLSVIGERRLYALSCVEL